MSYLPEEEENLANKDGSPNDSPHQGTDETDGAGTDRDFESQDGAPRDARQDKIMPEADGEPSLSAQPVPEDDQTPPSPAEDGPHFETVVDAEADKVSEDDAEEGLAGMTEPSIAELTEIAPELSNEQHPVALIPAGVGEAAAESEMEVSDEEPPVKEGNDSSITDHTLEGIAEIVSSDEGSGEDEPKKSNDNVDELAHIIEAIIFASDEPLTAGTIKSVLDASRTFGRLTADMITDRIAALNNKYDLEGSGFRIAEIANGYQFATRKEVAQWVSNLFKERSKRKLSTSALESLAIIAYKQPITKPEIESIRGVNVDYVLHNLLEKELVTVVGRAETVGRPLLYGTTQKFLKIFALKSLEDLPKLREIDEIIKEIKSKGAEESIQLEITALGEQTQTEGKAESDQSAQN